MSHILRSIAVWSALAVLIGTIVGVFDALFGRCLLALSSFRSEHFLYLAPFLAIAGIITVYLYQHFGKEAGKGMGLIFNIGHRSDETVPLRLIPMIMISTWFTHLFGGSAGREGVAVQIGATVANYIGDLAKIKNRHFMIMVGMAPGFSGLFQTPIAATFFAVEVITAGTIYFRAILPAFIASVVSAYTAHYLGLEKFAVTINTLPTVNPYVMIKLLIIGALFGLIGFSFASLLTYTKSKFSSLLSNPYIKIILGSIILSILLLVLNQGRYAGLGTNLIALAFNGGHVFFWDFSLKFLLTILTLAIGFQGGEVTPLFAIGATLGIVLAPLFGLPLTFVAALGYAAVFAAATNTFFSPILIGCEVFGFSLMPYLVITVAASYALNFNRSIYTGQTLRFGKKI